MEESRPTLNTNLIQDPDIQKQLNVLERAVDIAQKEMDYKITHDEEVIKAIYIVERFLRKSGRVCYGGQAINAYLPKKLKFYSEEYDIPDYDFFTPTLERDLRELVNMLQKEGFTDIYEKPGIHEGTTKVYVNFIAIADMTEVSKDVYSKFSKTAENISGIYYLGPDLLRMNMYLELSRPRGDLTRWEKVFERLTLLNAARPIEHCYKPKRRKRITKIEPEIRQSILDYILAEKRVLAGAEIGFIYRTFSMRRQPEMNWMLTAGGPVVFFSPDLEKDTEALRSILHKKGVTIEKKAGYKDYIPKRVIIKKNRKIVGFLIDEISCNSYNDFIIENYGYLRIASLDTLIYLNLLLGSLTDDEKNLGGSLLCLAQRLIELENKMRSSPYSRYPFFSIRCSGHQKSFVSLLREKAMRKQPKKIARGKFQFTQKVKSRTKVKSNVKSKVKTRKHSKKTTEYK